MSRGAIEKRLARIEHALGFDREAKWDVYREGDDPECRHRYRELPYATMNLQRPAVLDHYEVIAQYLLWVVTDGPRLELEGTVQEQLNAMTYNLFLTEEAIAEKLKPAMDKMAASMNAIGDALAEALA